MSSKITKKGLELLTARYCGNPWVAGMDLRNEIRPEHDLGAIYNYDKKAKIYYASNHIICLDFVWIAT